MRLSSNSLLGRRMWTVRNLMFPFIFLADFGKAQQLDECVSGVVEVVENSASYDLTRSQTTGNVEWRYTSPGSTVIRLIGTCNASCALDSVVLAGFFSLTRLSSTSTRLTVKVTTRSIGRTTFQCQSSINGVICLADVVAPAVLSSASVTMTRAGSGWTVHGSVDVTTVYSSLGRYSCQWFQTFGTGEQSVDSTLTLSPDPSDTNNTQNRTGHCSFSKALHSNPGTYTYRVVVSPGKTPSQRSVEIASPSAPSLTCSPSPYVPDNTKVTCTCNTQIVGKPAGRLMWSKVNGNNNPINTGNDGDASLTMTPYTMTRGEGDVQFRCDVDWVTSITGQPYSVNVSYGPGRVTIPENRTFYTDSAASRDLTITCQASDVRPSTGLIYTWTGRCADVTTTTCTFKPRPQDSHGHNDVNTTVVCTVKNPSYNNFSTQDTFRLDLKYPPLPPAIGGYSQGQVLYQGDSLTLTCTVTGGDPTVTRVALTCPSHHDNAATSGQSSSLTIPSLNASDHGIECRCSGQWVRPDYYTLADNRTLVVYYSPSIPTIRRADNLPFPYLEGDTVRLSCDLQPSRGNPNADITWSGHSQITAPADPPATLVMTSVGKELNNRNMRCTANNSWTQHKGKDISSAFTLLVYYSPVVSLTPQEDMACQTVDNTTWCAVTQGQRVHVTCSADSNPPPATFVWRMENSHDNDLDIGTGPDLQIPQTNHIEHNGNFTCKVTTGNLQGNGRHPLSSSQHLTLLVKYAPGRPVLTLNNNNGNLTVSEGNTVVLACRADGRPTPNISLVKSETRKEVQSVAGGDLVVDDRDSWLNHALANVSCSDTGTYTCTAQNDVDTGPTDSGALFVLCTPRSADPPLRPPPSVNYRNQSAQLTFNLWAYPTPVSHHIVFLGSTLNVTQSAVNVTGIVFEVSFRVTGELYDVSCDVTVVSMEDASAAGFYRLTVANTLGPAEMVFQVHYNKPSASPHAQRDSPVGAAVGGAVAGVVVAAAVAVGVVLSRRRKGVKNPISGLRKKARGFQRKRGEQSGECSMIINNVYGESGNTDVRTARSEYEAVGKNGDKQMVTLSTAPPVDNSNAVSGTVNKDTKAHVKNECDHQKADETYASVDKSKKTSHLISGKAGASGEMKKNSSPGSRPDNNRKPGTSSKPHVKPKPRQEEKPTNTKKNKGKDHPEKVYGNMTPLSMKPMEGSVYENYGCHGDETSETGLSKANKTNRATCCFSDWCQVPCPPG